MIRFTTTIPALRGILFFLILPGACLAQAELAPGLVATFRDDVRSVSEIVALPELGLAEGETPHPAIGPAFSARYEGFLDVAQAGTYQFDTKGTLSLNGGKVVGPIELDAGKHPFALTYQGEQGAVRFGVSWQSGHFAKEPLPPSAFFHKPVPPFPENADGTHPAPSHRIRTTLAAMKCASCHDGNFLHTMHHKFAPDSLLALMRHANTPKWYGAMTGPLFEETDALRQLAKDLRKLPNGDRTRGETAADTTQGKRMSGTQQGLACIACHDIKHHKTEAESKGPNLALMTERVTYDWFVRWMENPQRHKPGVPMPAFFAGQEPAVRQQNIDALWDYLAQGEKMELPEELHVDPNQFVLKPSTHPIHTRTYIRLPDGRELLRAICVGLPNGISYCFDAETCQLAYVWTGGFLDMAPHWQNQSGMPTPPLGAPFHLAAKDEGILIDGKAPAFLGYEIVDGIPRFEFAVGDGGGRGGSTIRDSMSLGALLYLRPDMRHLGNDAINPQWIWRFSPEELAAYEKLPSALPTTLSHRQELLPGDDPDTVALRIRFKDGRTDWIAVASKERELKAGEQTGRGVALWERTDASGKVTELIPLQPKPDNTQ